MTQIELIRQEIERRIKSLNKQAEAYIDADCETMTEETRIKKGELRSLLSFLDTLQGQTVTDSKKLEEEINKYLDGPTTDLRTMARHFYNLGLQNAK